MKSKKLLIAVLAVMMIAVFCLAGCGGSGEPEEAAPAVNEYGLEDGTYVATFSTDSGMFHVNEANNEKGILTVAFDHSGISGRYQHTFYSVLRCDCDRGGDFCEYFQ